MPFQKLRLAEPLLRAVASQGYQVPTPIQVQAIPHVLEGRDVLGCAQTGTGKTAAFALPILQRLDHRPAAHAAAHAAAGHGRRGSHTRPIRGLILSPTRELAAQIGESFAAYGKHSGLRHTVIFGGVGQRAQTDALGRGVDILVATPGRLLDLMGQGYINLKSVEIFVLDEADRMLDMGFIHDIRRVIAQVPAKRQTLLFSATMPPEIRKLAATVLHNPVEVTVAAESMAADTVEQALYFVDSGAKLPLLQRLLSRPDMTRTLVFTRTKHGADKVARRLVTASIAAEAIHSNKSQNARLRALANFKSGRTAVLVASDIASRGLDVDEISHVVNFDLPHEPETYVHRIGRTGRAGSQGIAISFCTDDQRDDLRAIEKLLGRRIPVLKYVPQPGDYAEPPADKHHSAHAQAHTNHGQPPHGEPAASHASHASGGHRPAQQPQRPHGGHGQRAGGGGSRRQHGQHSAQSAGQRRPTAGGGQQQHGQRPHGGKPATPEQQKTSFWRRRRRPRRGGR
jgi:ATP-dependent RNA helicase RhlE